MRTKLVFLSIAVALGSVATAHAIDKVNRKTDPKPVQGDVTAVTKDQVTVKDGLGKTSQVPTSDIVGIDWGAEPSVLPLGRGAEKNNRADAALEQYALALKDPKAKGDIKLDIEFLIARVTARTALDQDSTKLDDAAKKLETWVKTGGNHYRFYEAATLLGDVLLAKQDFSGAETQYGKLAQAPFPEYKLAAKNAAAKVAMANNDLPGALAKFDEVLGEKGDTPAEALRRNEALVGKASVLVAQKNYDEAMKALTSAIEALNAEDSAVMAEAYVLQGDCLQAQDKTKEAILAYLHVPLLFEKEKNLHARALFHLATLWPKVDQPERGEQAKQELKDSYPESSWAKQLP